MHVLRSGWRGWTNGISAPEADDLGDSPKCLGLMQKLRQRFYQVTAFKQEGGSVTLEAAEAASGR